MHKNIKCWLCSDRDEIMNVSECSKLSKYENTDWHNLVGKSNHWDMCKRLKFGLLKNGIFNKSESIQENKSHYIL